MTSGTTSIYSALCHMCLFARPSYSPTVPVVPILPIPHVGIVMLVLLAMLVVPIVLVASGGICTEEQIDRIDTTTTPSRKSTTMQKNVIATIGKTSTIDTFGTTINRYVDGGPEVPGVTGVPGVHGVAKLIDGPILDLPGTLKDIHYLVASFCQSQRRCARYHTTLY